MTNDETSSEYDQWRDAATVDEVAAVAATVLREHGDSIEGAIRALGWSNATWLARDYAVRVQVSRGPGDLLRESELVRRLPEAAGHPAVVASGVTDDHEWMLTKLVRGTSLGEAWQTLRPELQAKAIGQIWDRASEVHRAATALEFARDTSPFHPSTPEETDAQIGRLVAVGALGDKAENSVREACAQFWHALPQVGHVLNHGDIGPHNAVWNGDVVALVDYEFAMVAPVELDLSALVKSARKPGGEALDLAGNIASSARDERFGADLILGYSVMREMFGMERWLEHWDGAQSFGGWEPYESLRALLKIGRDGEI
jgi:phosphotransferase family enzyme